MIGSSSAGPFFEVIFILFVAELVIIGLLTFPFEWMGLAGLRTFLVRWISTSNLLASLAKPLLYFSVLVGLSFLFTTREMLKLQDEYHEATAGDLAQKCARPMPPAVERGAPTRLRAPRRAGCSTSRGCSAPSATST